MAGPAEFVWVNLPSLLSVFFNENRIVKAKYSLAWYSTCYYLALTSHRHLSIISIQKSAYPCRDTLATWVTTLHSPFRMYISEIDCGSKFRWVNGVWTCLLIGLWIFCQQVAIIFVADFVQPLFLSIYLYRTLIVHFGMRCYFAVKSFT